MLKNYGKECDLWSVGVFVYTLLTGALPFAGETLDEVLEAIQSGVRFDGPEWEGTSEDAVDFVRNLLVVSPKARATVDQCLSHPWIQ
jgi:serine/threonine protein kinase